MSIKIDNGYKLPKMDLEDLMVFLHKFAKEIRNVAIRKICKIYAYHIINVIDSLSVNPHAKVNKDYIDTKNLCLMPLMYAWKVYQNQIRKMNAHKYQRDHIYDMDCSIIVFPKPDTILAMIFAEQKEFRELWETQDHVEEYGYWNNTDKPDNLTQEEWDTRLRNWKEIFEVYGNGIWAAPAQSGLKFTCFSNENEDGALPTPEKIVEFIPSFAYRIENKAKELTFVEYTKEHEALAETGHCDIVSLYYAWAKWIDSEEGKETLAAKIEEIRTNIKIEITPDDLTKNIPVKELEDSDSEKCNLC